MWIQIRDNDESMRQKIRAAIKVVKSHPIYNKIKTISAFVRLCANNAEDIIKRYS